MTQKKLKDLELKIRQGVEKALEEGYLLRYGSFTQNGSHVCLMGALLPKDGDGLVRYSWRRQALAEVLKIDQDDLFKVECGFEATLDGAGSLYQLGARIRRDYCEFGKA